MVACSNSRSTFLPQCPNVEHFVTRRFRAKDFLEQFVKVAAQVFCHLEQKPIDLADGICPERFDLIKNRRKIKSVFFLSDSRQKDRSLFNAAT
jgi:hypothetical protein